MWPNPQETADLVTFTEEIFNGKLHFFAAVYSVWSNYISVDEVWIIQMFLKNTT